MSGLAPPIFLLCELIRPTESLISKDPLCPVLFYKLPNHYYFRTFLHELMRFKAVKSSKMLNFAPSIYYLVYILISISRKSHELVSSSLASLIFVHIIIFILIIIIAIVTMTC